MKTEKYFVVLLGIFFIGITFVMLFLPKSQWSELERRELQQPPELELDALFSGEYAQEVSAWFSDSEPYRDDWMRMSLDIKSSLSFRRGEDALTYHPMLLDDSSSSRFKGKRKAVMDGSPVLVCGEAPTARALMPFVGSAKRASRFANIINRFDSLYGDFVNVYCMPVPLAFDFYCPAEAQSVSKPQRPAYDSLMSRLNPRIRRVDVYDVLAQHTDEPIYLRTDHHWTPLGGYYAAQVMAQLAGTSVPCIDDYEPRALHDFVGTLYGYSRDKTIADSPEDFCYYVPRAPYSAVMTTYETDRNFDVVDSVGTTSPCSYFLTDEEEMRHKAFGVYSFSGPRLLQVHTSEGNGRRLLVLKDSFGDAVPSFLFGSFEEVHVADHRYFPHSLGYYINEHGITDLLFIQCMQMATARSMYETYSSWFDGVSQP